MSGHALHIKLDGRTYSDTYSLNRKVLTVKTNFGSKSAEVSPKESKTWHTSSWPT